MKYSERFLECDVVLCGLDNDDQKMKMIYHWAVAEYITRGEFIELLKEHIRK